jgi:glycerol-3-phosphate acyltransferase PlsY
VAVLAFKMLLAYLLGSVLGGDLMRRLAGGADLRESGSGNVGATNALRTRGAGFAAAVLLFDVGKGIAGALLIPLIAWPSAGHAASLEAARYACGYCVALGHCYPVFAGFRGGKGVATLAGVFAALLPAALPWMLALFAGVLLFTGYVSLSSVAAAVAALFWATCASGSGLWSPPGGFALAAFALVLFKHRHNLVRIFHGREGRFQRARLIGNRIDRWRAR